MALRCITLILLLMTAPPIWATDYHVAASGSDLDPGTLSLPGFLR